MDLRLLDPSETGDLRFEVFTEETSVEIGLSLISVNGEPDCKFTAVGRSDVVIKVRNQQALIENFFYSYPPTIWFVDGSTLDGNIFIELKKRYEPYPIEKIDVWDWTGIDLTKNHRK